MLSQQPPIKSIQDLTTELESQLRRLGLIQDEIGFSTETKEQKITQLLTSVAQFVNNQIDLVEKEKHDIIKETENIQKAILSYKGLMGEFASETAVLDPAKSLQKNLEDLNAEQAEVKQVSFTVGYLNSY
jgi:microcystin degradation protein MlrC